MNMIPVISQLLVLFALVGIGYIEGKRGRFTPQFNHSLTNFVMDLALPGVLLNAALQGDRSIPAVQVGVLLLLLFAAHLISMGLGLLFCRLTRCGEGQKDSYFLMIGYGNVGFMGMPVATAVFGSGVTIYVALIILAFNVCLFTLGVAYMERGNERHRFPLRSLLKPCTLAAIAALIFYLLNVKAPAPVLQLTGLLGQLSSPLAMLLVGASLSQVKLMDCFRSWRLYGMAAVRLLLIPALLYVGLRNLLVDNPMAFNTIVLCMGMPVAASTTMLLLLYHKDATTASEGTLLTTVLSLATMPLLAFLLLS